MLELVESAGSKYISEDITLTFGQAITPYSKDGSPFLRVRTDNLPESVIAAGAAATVGLVLKPPHWEHWFALPRLFVFVNSSEL